MMPNLKSIIFLIALYCTSCSNIDAVDQIDISILPVDVQRSLNVAGLNKIELLKVISHYRKLSEDSLKLKSAYFLIANMEHFRYYKGDLLNKYLDYPEYLPKEMHVRKINAHYFDSLFGQFTYDALNEHYDINEISAQDLQNNIDMAFKVWQEQPWGRNYDFNQFCEFILPWRMGDEIPDYSRNEIYDRFEGILNSVRERKGDAIDACIAINNELKKKGWFLIIGMEFLPHMPISKLLSYQTGACRDQADLGAYVMRSQGIPVAIDFVPQWPTRGGNHIFNAVIDKKGKPVLFNAADDNPGMSTHIDMKKGKVYRHIFYKNMASLAVLKDPDEEIPSLFMDPYIRDVTDEYCDCSEVHLSVKRINILEGRPKHAYICVFDNKQWIPIGWSEMTKDTIIFKKMENDILYMPAVYIGGSIVPINDPFILRRKNVKTFLRPNFAHLIKVVKIRKIFPITPDRTAKLYGCFESSTNPDFYGAMKLFSFTPMHKINPFWNNIEIKCKDSFRFVRYFQKRECTIGEIEFYSGRRKLIGKIIGSNPIQNNNLFSKEKAVDGDIGTSFFSKDGDSWIGLDFGRNEKLDSIRFSPGIGLYGPDYDIKPGHIYELQCWYNNKWLSIRNTKALGDSVLFNNLPSSALYLLHDLNTQEESRTFTIQDGVQIWL